MKVNVICFANPTAKIYTELLPPRQDLDDMIAFIFTGPCQPTDDDLKWTPLLVRHKKVKYALDWLKLNHIDYYDIEISEENLSQYKDNGVSFEYEYQEALTSNDSLTTAINDNDEDDQGTEMGPCPY